MCWRDGLHQADHYLDLFSIILNSAAFSLPHLQYLIATLMTDNTWLLTPTAACPEQGTSSLFSYHLQVHSTYSGMKTEGVGGGRTKEKRSMHQFIYGPFHLLSQGVEHPICKNARFTLHKSDREGKNTSTLPAKELI